jgi:hypothetical protein
MRALAIVAFAAFPVALGGPAEAQVHSVVTDASGRTVARIARDRDGRERVTDARGNTVGRVRIVGAERVTTDARGRTGARERR